MEYLEKNLENSFSLSHSMFRMQMKEFAMVDAWFHSVHYVYCDADFCIENWKNFVCLFTREGICTVEVICLLSKQNANLRHNHFHKALCNIFFHGVQNWWVIKVHTLISMTMVCPIQLFTAMKELCYFSRPQILVIFSKIFVI